MNFNKTKAVAKKEFKHLIRDIRMLSILLFFPVFLLGIFGYAVNFDVQNIKLTVYDKDNSGLSRSLIRSISSSNYFNHSANIISDNQIKKVLDNKEAQVLLVIPKNFEKEYYSSGEAGVQYLIDGVDGNTPTIIQSYVIGATQHFNQKINSRILERRGGNTFRPVNMEPVFWYNPDLKTTRFLIPGLIAMILIVTAAISVSLSLVREKERGTIEQINVSPVKSGELILGKTFPYLMLSFLNAIIILIAGYFLFDVEVRGSLMLLFLTTLIFLLASTSIGILVSVVSDSQQVAFSIATFATLLPSLVLSGFIFPIESMPFIIQIFTNITPAKFFIEILRAIVIRGAGIETFWQQAFYLILFSAALLCIANIIYKRKEKLSS